MTPLATGLDFSRNTKVWLLQKGSVAAIAPTKTGSSVALPGRFPQVTVGVLRKLYIAKEKKKMGKRESDGNRGKTRVTGRAFTQRKALVLNLSLLLNMCFFFLDRDRWKTSFFLLDQRVIRPNCFLQLGVLLCLFMALRSGFLGQMVIILTGFEKLSASALNWQFD